MKLNYVLMLMAAMVMGGGLLTGCNKDPYVIEADTYSRENYPRQIVLDESLQDAIVAQRTIVTPSEDGRPMQIDAAIRNTTDHNLKLQYKVQFYDARGRYLEGADGWQLKVLQPKARIIIQANSISDRAEDWTLEIRPAS